jgi:methionyl-tRNA formyltransferase
MAFTLSDIAHSSCSVTMAPLKIVFAGTPDFSVPTLNALIDAGHDIRAVYTQPDRPSGRGRRLTASPVKETATANGLPLFQPGTLRDAQAIEVLRRHGAELMVVVAYGLLLPKGVLEAPPLGCVNVHASLLPRWRGAAPIQRCILAGDRESGVTIMRLEEGLDTGPLYLKRRIPVESGETGGSLHDRLAKLGASALMEALPGIAEGTLVPELQDDALATYAKKLGKEEAWVDWTRPAIELDRLVRAFDPWPVAQTKLGDITLRLRSSEIRGEEASPEPPGRVVAAGRGGIDVATGQGLLRITRLQVPGKRPIPAAEFLKAHRLQGCLLG